MEYLANAFSLNMIDEGVVTVERIPMRTVLAIAQRATSIVGHQATADVFTDVLGINVSLNRATVTLKPGDTVLVGQYSGPRLEEGTKVLPQGASIKWLLVSYAYENAYEIYE